MKTLFQKETADEIINRINSLSPNAQRLWGKMNVDQMLVHCSISMKTATGELFLKSGFLLKLVGSLFKNQTTNDKPFRTGSPTHKGLTIGEIKGFESERKELISQINKFQNGGEEICTTNPHAFFGKLSPLQWGSLMYKHTDHHLRQFGV